MLAGMAVTLAEPSGLWGTTSVYAVLEANRYAGANELAKALAADIETSDGFSVARDGLKTHLTGNSPAEIKQQAIAALGAGRQILDAKAPADAPAFKAWLKHVAEKVADASTEGGFLGLVALR